MSAVFYETDPLRKILSASARTLDRIYQDASREKGDGQSRAIRWLRGERWFIESQIEELDAALTAESCGKLPPSHDAPTAEPRVYQAISGTISCLVSNQLGLRALGKLLTTPALVELLNPERLGTSLTTPELWAVPAVVKLILLERITRSVSTGLLESEQCESEIRSAIECLHSVARIRWDSVIESISAVHCILSQDPCGTYLKMDFESRDLYRRGVADLAEESGQSEEYIARCAVNLAAEASAANGRMAECDVGYYLIGAGIPQLRSYGELRAPWPTRLREFATRAPNAVYVGSILTLTLAFTAVFARFAGPLSWWWIALLLLPASSVAVSFVNIVVNLALQRRRMPRLDFSRGIPPEHRACVAVPTLLLSRAGVAHLLERLEINYLANRDSNLVFALLTDLPDSATLPKENPLLEFCGRGIQRLNQRYAGDVRAPFYLFHRRPQWNESQRAWIGRERKRGKLEDFNRFLLGLNDPFDVKIGDLSTLGSVQHVITLDTDTQLPRDAAWKLVGTLAHPLQRPALTPGSDAKLQGYAILQPLVKTNMESAGKSRFAKILGGQTGLDPYTCAIADLYHDLYGRASFAGKGIYDLRTVHALLDGRFPDNTLLSHDLIEGEHASVGLVTDVDLIEDYPHSYEAWAKRRHRWIRGDWQILEWLLPRVPGPRGQRLANPLPLVSRWKLTDNLRRSLVDINLFVLLSASWLFVPAAAVRLSIGALFVLVSPAYLELFATAFKPSVAAWRSHLRERASGFWRAHHEALVMLAFLPHQAMIAADAIVRTLVRRFVTRRNMLEWESMAQVEAGTDSLGQTHFIVLACVAIAVFGSAYLHRSPLALPFLLGLLWLASPLVARFLRNAPRRDEQSNDEVEFLRDISLRTWRYFADFSRPENHWLVPDNIQEEPEAIAHRASPTNIGLQLASYVAAFDFGYITHQELARHLEDVLAVLAGLDRYRGHFFNWYDTQTAKPLPPGYVSTVDSGNLAAALIAVKQACEGVPKQRLATMDVFEGLRDHCLRLRRILPQTARRTAAPRLLTALIRQLRERPRNLFLWERALVDVTARVDELNRCLANVGNDVPGAGTRIKELHYWRQALTRRARTARAGLWQLAPWLKDSYTAALKTSVPDPRYENLLAILARVPALSDLPDTYDSIDNAITQLLSEGSAASDSPKPEQSIQAGVLDQLRRDVEAAREDARSLLAGFARAARDAAQFACSMDFTFLFDADRDLLRIGYNTQKARLDEGYYDLLASEARTAVFFAVAKGDVPRQTWFRLGRKAARFRGYRTLVSWSGTMFEYLMPSIFMKTFPPSLLGQSLNGIVQVQQAYARERNVPWGISESSCSSRGQDANYDYHAFGIPAVSLTCEKPTNLVVAPYASMLALMIDRQPAATNLRIMASRGWTGRYGFFDAVDFHSGEALSRQACTVVRSFMAHHQGMGLLALCNALLGNPMQRRFHSEPMVAATELLLQERVPAMYGVAEELKAAALGT